jgi:hypothetical protein
MSKPAFDTSTGILTIDSVAVGPGFSRSELWSSPIGPKLEELASNEPYHSWKAAVEVGSRSFVACFFFTEEHLTDVTLTLTEGLPGKSWEEWSEEAEQARKVAHERWLEQESIRASGTAMAAAIVRAGQYERGRLSGRMTDRKEIARAP